MSLENIVGVGAALFPIVAGALAWLWRRVRRGRRIGYRVQMDTAIGREGGDGQNRPNVRTGLFNELPVMPGATLVLLRIENNGTESIADGDYENPDRNYGLTVVFRERTIRGIEAIPDPRAESLMRYFRSVDGTGGMQHTDSEILLPRVPLRPRRHFKLLVLLNGGRVGDDVTLVGDIRDGAVKPTKSITIDDDVPLFNRRSLGVSIVLGAVVIGLGVFIGLRPPQILTLRPPPIGCVGGSLTVVGSTAFAPTLEDLAQRYQADCRGSRIKLDTRGSNGGVTVLKNAGDASPGHPPAMVAISDGPKPASFTQLTETRVAVSTFALVVNDQVKAKDLSVDQIRAIYRGDILSWKDLGGPDLPIRIVSRNADSGTRNLFRRHILGGAGEPAFTSRDCVKQDFPDDRVIRCELGSTDQVLKTVAHVPGAIGYSELQAATATKGLHILTINGQEPSLRSVDTYPFTEIEYAYTYGVPVRGSLAAAFLNYMARGSGQQVLTTHGDLPCFSPEGLERCRK